MADIKKSGYMKYKDKAGNMYRMMPITNVDNVEGLTDALADNNSIMWVEYGDTSITGQTLCDARDAKKMVYCKYQNKLYCWASDAYPIPNSADYVFYPVFGSPSVITSTDDNGNRIFTSVYQTKALCLIFSDLDKTGGGRTWSVFTKAKGFVQEGKHASQHKSTGSDPITPADIGAATMTEVNAAIQSAIQNTWEASY